MNQVAPTVVVGLDAFDPTLAVELAAAGRLPTIAKLLVDGAQAAVRNAYGLFVGATWPTLTTGQAAGRVGYHSWLEVDSRTVRRELRSPERVGPAFWEAVGRGGHRVAVLDVPHRRAGGELNGVHVSEWGCHDRHWGLRSTPPELAAELVARYGLHPVLGLDPYTDRDFAPDDHFARADLVRTEGEDVELTAGLLDGIERKCALSVDVLWREPWDLFVAVFGESHAAGHHLWHHHDPNHPRHDPAVAQRLDDPLARIYERLDDAVGEHLARVPDETTFLVLLSHGMTAHYDGTHLIEEVLRRLDALAAGGVSASLHSRALIAAPRSVRRVARRPLAAAARQAARRRPLTNWWGEWADHDWTRQRWFLSPNNTVCGGVRVNVRGREANGIVEPDEFDAVCAELAADLLELVNVETGGPVVRAVRRTDEVHARQPGDALPDLIVDWDHAAPIETIWSPKTGLIHGRYDLWRTGDHRPDGLLLARGPGIVPGPQPDLRSIDLPVTLAARFGVELDDADGRVQPWLVPERPDR